MAKIIKKITFLTILFIPIVFATDEIIEYGTVNPINSGVVVDDPYSGEPVNPALQPGTNAIDGVQNANRALEFGEGEKKFQEVVNTRKSIHDMVKGGVTEGPNIPDPPFKASESPLTETGPVTFMGSPLFMKCQRQTPKKWDELMNDIQRTGDEDDSVDVDGMTSGLVESGNVDERWETAWYRIV